MSIYYFGFGANKDPDMIAAITGRKLDGRPAFIEGFDLIIQSLRDIPEPAKTILQKTWGTGFQSYALKYGSNKVHGMLWKVSRDDLAHIAQWELEAENWFCQIEVVATLEEDNTKVVAITQIVKKQLFQKIVTQKDYPPFIVPRKKIIEIAVKVREKLI